MAQKDQQVQQYYNACCPSTTKFIRKRRRNSANKEREATELYKKHHASGDADLISKADSLKNGVAIQKEKVRIAKQKQEANSTISTTTTTNISTTNKYSQVIASQHKSFGVGKKKSIVWSKMLRPPYAQYTHMNLVNEGFEPDSEEYYNELNDRVYKVYPDLQSDNAEQIEGRPAVQRVASASVGGRQKTQGKKNGVQFLNQKLPDSVD